MGNIAQQNIAAIGGDKDIRLAGMQGANQLQQIQAKGDIESGLRAAQTANELGLQGGLTNIQIGQSQEALRNQLIGGIGQNFGGMARDYVSNIQGGQRQQEMLRGTGQLQRDMLVGQTDQQMGLQEAKFEGEQSLIAGQALTGQQQLIGQTKRDQAMLYGNLQADKVRADIAQGRQLESAREKFQQDFAMQDAAFKQEMAKKRFGANMAFAGQRGFA